MKKPIVFVLAAVTLGGCPSDPGTNPPVLFFAPNAAETQVKLIDHEPPPF